MHGTVLVSLVICVGGAVAHLATDRLATLGAWGFGVGLWWFLYAVVGSVVHIG